MSVFATDEAVPVCQFLHIYKQWHEIPASPRSVFPQHLDHIPPHKLKLKS